MTTSLPPFATTGIGSAPHASADDACAAILASFDIPFWPQLPRRSFRESMVLQYAEGMPFLRIREAEEKCLIERDESDELDRFYESASPDSRIAISEDYAAGLHAFLRKIRDRRFGILKGHITGPLTFTLGLKDTRGVSIYFDEEMREIGSMLLQAKSRWQVDVLRQHADRVIIFMDEPILTAIGSSSYLGVTDSEVTRLISDSAAAIEAAGAIPGLHSCGKADWPMIIGCGVKILNFDAHDYFDTLAIYHQEVKAFLEQGGYLAWGIVPTSDAISSVTEESLVSLFRERLDMMQRQTGSDLIYTRSLITPSCGAGSRSVEEATRIFQLTLRLREALAG